MVDVIIVCDGAVCETIFFGFFGSFTGTSPSTQMHVISRHYEKKRNEGGKGEEEVQSTCTRISMYCTRSVQTVVVKSVSQSAVFKIILP